ncbi:MAG: tandem-95 repeat protein, partial [Cyanobacteria bacterium K_DeepCast_35m_m2_023]|nr:tandem-95 repeat protein [Cyanobacteria bacterium K_DeepCast_35m_m2_023]
TLTLTYTLRSTDSSGATGDRSITLTLTGTNDTPLISNGPDTAALTETNASISTTGSMTVTDIDLTDTITATVDSVVISGGTFNAALVPLTNAELKAMLTLSATGGTSALPANPTAGTNFTWTFTSGPSSGGGNKAFEFLAAGETLELTYTVKAQDNSPDRAGQEADSTSSTVTITVTGSNDGPIATFTSGQNATEDSSLLTGQLTATDLDTNDSRSYGLVGTAIPGFSLNASGAWSFNPGNATYQSLRLGQSQVIPVTYQVTDGAGASSQASFTITVAGSNDTPVATFTAPQSATEDGALITGQLTATDADAGDTRSFSLVGSAIPGLTISSSGGWSFDPSHAAYQSLKAGQTQAIPVTYQVSDATGATSQAIFSITVTGTNDGPIAIGPTPTLPQGQEGTPYVIRAQDLLVGVSDVDQNDSLSIANLRATNGTLVNNNNGTWTFTPVVSNAINLGEILEDHSKSLTVDALLGGSRTAIQVQLLYDVIDSSGAAVNGRSTSFELARTSSINTVTVSNLMIVRSEPAIVMSEPDHTLTANSNNTWTFTPSPNWFGTVQFAYTISTGANPIPYTAALIVQSVNDAPIQTGTPPAPLSILEDSANTNAVSLGMANLNYTPGGGTDESSQTLTYTVTAIPSSISLFKADGSSPVTSNTSLTLTELQGLTYKTLPNANGTGNLSWTVQDSGGTANGGINTLAQSLNITVGALNDPPIRIAPTPPLPPGQELTPYVIRAQDLLVGISDVDQGDQLRIANLRATNGTLVDNNNGTWTFTPVVSTAINLVPLQEDNSRTLTVNDLLGGSTTAIQVQLLYDVIDNAGAALTGNTTSFALTRTSALDTVTVSNLSIVSGLGTFTPNNNIPCSFTPSPNWFGTVQFAYTISTGATITPYTASLVVQSVNDPPELTSPASLTTIEDTPLTLTGFSVADVDGDELTLTLKVGRGTLLLDTAPGLAARSGNGSTATPLQLRGPIAALNAALALIRYQPDANATGSDQLSISAIDATTQGMGGPALIYRSVPISITAVNDPPARLSGTVAALVLNEDAPATSLGLQQLSYGPGGGADEASQTLSYNVTTVPPTLFGGVLLADGTPVSAAQVLTLAQLRGLQFQANPNASGLGSFSYTVSDGVGGTLTETVAIQVREQNDPPARLGTIPAELVVSEASGISSLGLATARYAPAALLTQPGTALAAMELGNGNKILGLINPAANQFTALISANYQGMLGDEVVAQRPGSTELFIRQSNAILRIDLSTGQQTTLLNSAPMLLGYRPNGDALVVYDPTTAQIQAVNLTTATSTTLATGVLPGASIQAGGFASFNAATDQVTLLSRTNAGVVLTSVILSTGVQTSTTANLPDLQALAGSSNQPNQVFGL